MCEGLLNYLDVRIHNGTVSLLLYTLNDANASPRSYCPRRVLAQRPKREEA